MRVGTLIDKALTLLGDKTGKRWGRTTMYGHAGQAARLIAAMRPDLFPSATVPHTLLAGADQIVPATLEVFQGAATVGGVPIRNTDKQILDDALPEWRAMPAGTTTDCLFDANFPRQFHVYPPATAGNSIVLRGVAAIADPTTDNDELPTNGVSESALIFLMMALAYSENTGTAATQAKAELYESKANQLLGVEKQIRRTSPPKQQAGEA